jgi:hypothetical protein
MTPNRIVAVLTPLVFAPAAGAISAWVANHAPGIDLSKDELMNIFIAGALVALAPAVQWLHGWQKYEERQAQADQAIELATATAGAAAYGAAAADEDAAGDDDDTYADEDETALDELEALADDGAEDEDDPLIADAPVTAGAGA